MRSRFTDEGIPNPDLVTGKVSAAFQSHPNWRTSEADLREARKQVTFATRSQGMRKIQHGPE